MRTIIVNVDEYQEARRLQMDLFRPGEDNAVVCPESEWCIEDYPLIVERDGVCYKIYNRFA